jgi:flotillin
MLVAAGILILLIAVTLITGYVKASPDEAIIISGLKKTPKVVIGKAAVKIPFFERKDRLTLRAMKIDVKTSEAVPTQEFINVLVDSVVTVKISSEKELLAKASENFLNKDEDYIRNMVQDVLEGNIREIVGTMSLTNMISDRQKFSEKVQQNAVPDMRKLGLEIVSFNVQNFADREGVINDLGIDNVAKIQKNAKIVKAEAERDVKIAQAQANKEANDAEVASQEEIAIKNNQLEIKRAELKQESDTKKAQADAAYKIQEEEQRRTIEITSANANLAKQEKEIELKERAVQIMERELDATIKKKADADKYAKEKAADARLYEIEKSSEADKIKAENEALALKATAEANAFAKKQDADAQKAYMMAEADGIEAKGLAEAKGVDAKAEAMKKMEEAAVLEMFFKVLPEVAANIAKPLENIDKITMYGEGNNAKLVGDITKSMTQVMNGVTDATGLDVKGILSAFIGGKIAQPDLSGIVNTGNVINPETVETLEE